MNVILVQCSKRKLARADYFIAAGHGRGLGVRRQLVFPARKDRELMEPGGGAGCAGAGVRGQPAVREHGRGNGMGIGLLSLFR